ncbi:hypothetical protein [Novosphingobium sp.]|nr:hypothetical protein [Novosphingobium sp.]
MPIGDALVVILHTLRDPRLARARQRMAGPLARLAGPRRRGPARFRRAPR